MTLLKLSNPAQNKINNVFETFLNELPPLGKAMHNNHWAATNIIETDHGYELEIMVPGCNKEDFSITLDKEILTVEYKKKQPTEAEKTKVVLREFNTNNFKRCFTIDSKINASLMKAKYENGLLHLFLPKHPETKQSIQTISIQ